MIGGDTLSITDYKHGKGVPVSAVATRRCGSTLWALSSAMLRVR
ncbi:MAG: hypothetical protein ACLSF6_03440 [Evtepia gabavorous]